MVADLNRRNIAILGCGNLGISIARGIVASKKLKSNEVWLTRRSLDKLKDMKEKEGFQITKSNEEAVSKCSIIVIGVLPAQVAGLVDSVKHLINKDHIIISVVLGITIEVIRSRLSNDNGIYTPIIRAMPNTAIQFCESMTCLAGVDNAGLSSDQVLINEKALQTTRDIFNGCGECIVITEELMISAPAICSCGTAFFIRMIRAVSNAGCEIGFEPHEAIKMAAQTAKGAAILLLEKDNHPESQIDKVTTPGGATIKGLNEFEHNGLSSAIMKGVVAAADKSLKNQQALNAKLIK